MDPQACLDACETSLKVAERVEDKIPYLDVADEYLHHYRKWRKDGGFEPENGDKRAQALRDQWVALLTPQYNF